MTNDTSLLPQILSWTELPAHAEDHGAEQISIAEIEFESPPLRLPGILLKSLPIGLINFYRFTQDCLITALDGLRSQSAMSNFMTVRECTAATVTDFNLVIYYLHGAEVSDTSILQTVGPICQRFPTVPLIVFSDAAPEQQLRIMRAVMKSGARGFVPTRTAGLVITLAAIQLVNAGGTFVPVDLLLTAPADLLPPQKNFLTSTTSANLLAPLKMLLTYRQMEVLAHLQRGNANKIIAYELGVSESTVKVHVRAIMGKMGATNRAQVVYKASTRDFFGGAGS